MNRKTRVFLVSALAIAALLIVLVVALLFNVPGAQAKRLMLYSFTTGQKLTQRMVMEQKIEMTVLGQEQAVDQTIGMEYDYEVVEVHSDGSAKLKCTYTWVQVKQDSANGLIDYETTTPEQRIDPTDRDFMGQVYGTLVGESFHIVVSSDGRITDLEGVNEIYSRMIEKIIIPEGAQIDKAQLEESMQSQFGEDALKEMMYNAFTPYSLQPVGIGDTWENTLVLSSGFPMTVDTTYKLVERGDDGSTIEIQSTVASNPDGEPMQSGPLTIRYEFQGDQHGTVVVDATGWAVDGRLTQNFSGEMVMEEQGGSIKVPMTVEGTVLIETTHWSD